MTCGSCAARIQKTLAKQPGVSNAEVNFATGRVRLSLDGTADLVGLQTAVEKAGYTLHGPAPVETAVGDFAVGGMTCGSCAARIRKVLQRQPGVADAEVNYATGRAVVTPVPGATFDSALLVDAVKKAGYELTGRTQTTPPATPSHRAQPQPSAPIRPTPTRQSIGRCGSDGP